MKTFSVSWKSSSKLSKQRKYRINAPLHLKRAFLSAPLSKELAVRYNVHILPAREGDTVRIVRGEFRGVAGKVNSVNLRRGVVYIDGAERVRKDGTKSFFPVRPSSLVLTELNAEDKRRISVLARKPDNERK